jgi:hypothetical protein
MGKIRQGLMVLPIPRDRWDTGPRQKHIACDWSNKPVRLHHTVTAFKYKSKRRRNRIREEREHMRLLKQIALGRGFADISYNYVAFPSGRIYVGRGEEVLGAHTIGFNANPGIALAGNYEVSKPSRAMVTNTSRFVSGYLHERYATKRRLIPHRNTFATSCPGKYAIRAFKLR